MRKEEGKRGRRRTKKGRRWKREGWKVREEEGWRRERVPGWCSSERRT